MANPQKENGYTAIANEIMDRLMKIRIPGVARQILDCILRQTYGYNKNEDHISLSQFQEKTGLGDVAVCKNIKILEQLNLVFITQKGNVTKLGNVYRLNKDYDTWRPLPKKVTTITQKGNAYLKKSLPKMVDTKVEVTTKVDITKVEVRKCPEANEILKFFKETYQISGNVPKQIQNWRAAKWLFQEKGLNKSKAAIQAAWACRGKEFAPSINNLMDLKEKYGKLEEFYYRQRNSKQKIGLDSSEWDRAIACENTY